MPIRTLFSCFNSRKKPQNGKVDQKPKKISTSGAHSESDSLSVNELNHIRTSALKAAAAAAEGNSSVKETLSLSNTSQTPGDTTSFSLAGWSAVHTVDGLNVSKVNLLSSEESASLVKPFVNALSRSTEWNDVYFERFESLVLRLESLAGIKPAQTCSSVGLSAFQRILDVVVPHYVTLSSQLGPELERQSLRVREAFELIYQLIHITSTFSKPPVHLLDDYYRPLSYKFLEIGDFDYANSDPLARLELTIVSDSVLILAWCANYNASVFVKEIKESANAFANKIFQSCYNSQSKHTDWIRAWMACLTSVQEVVDKHFQYGLIWSPDGPEAPVPPKPIPPILYHQHAKTPVQHHPHRVTGVSPPKPPKKSGQILTQEELLCEISQTRRNLRHVPDPDRFLH